MTERKTLSKKVRFEVFKRDSFRCQYCGAEAPNVLLHVDHIKPLAEDGTDDLMNLITSCEPCNAGKGARPLDDSTAVAKAKAQIDALQERREQIEMMMEWQQGLTDLKEDAVQGLIDYFAKMAPGWVPNATGRQLLRKHLSTFSVAELMEAMSRAADSYLEFKPDGTVTSDSWNKAFNSIPGIARVSRASKDDPDIREIFYIRGILRKRLDDRYYDNALALDDLKAARSWGVPIDELRSVVLQVRNWSDFRQRITDLIEEYRNP
jgi:hypothetical protein